MKPTKEELLQAKASVERGSRAWLTGYGHLTDVRLSDESVRAVKYALRLAANLPNEDEIAAINIYSNDYYGIECQKEHGTNGFDRMTEDFTGSLRLIADWKQNFFGATYASRIRQAISLLKDVIAEIEQHPEIKSKEHEMTSELHHEMTAAALAAAQKEWLRSEVGGTFRPNWKIVYENTTHVPDRDNDLLLITRETARLAASAIAETQTQDSYDNFQVALQEIRGVLK